MKVLRNIIPAGIACLMLAGGAMGEEAKTTSKTTPTAANIVVQLDGQNLRFDQSPVMRDGRVLVPLRGVFESMGADVVYDAATKNIKATGDDRVVELSLGSNSALVDGNSTYLDVPAQALNGRTLVPLRFVSESLGADVRWLPANRTVAIETIEEVAETPPPAPVAEIRSVVHNGQKLGQGGMLTVTMTGTPGATANFDLLGVKQDIPMSEVSPGSYKGQLQVEPGMKVANGTIVAQLALDGKTVQQESSTAINIDPSATATETMTLSPAEGTMVATETPLIKAAFARPVQPESIKLMVDGRDVSAWSKRAQDAVTYTPDPRLTKGSHTIAVQALDAQGNTLTEQWNFQVNGNTGDGYRPDLSVTNMTSGQSVDNTFDIEGKATPHSTIQLTAIRKGALEPQTVRVNGKADSGGNFDILMDTSSIPKGAQFDVEALAIDEQGDISDPVVIQLIRD